MNSHWRAPERLRAPVPLLRIFIRQHDVVAADLDLGMPDLAARLRQPHHFLRPEHPAVKFDRARRAFHHQVGRHCVPSLRNVFHFACHDLQSSLS